MSNKTKRKRRGTPPWIGFKFQRCEIVLKFHETCLNMEDENNYLKEYLTFENQI